MDCWRMYLSILFITEFFAVDTDRCADFIGKIKKINPNAEIVFHRAIDVVPDVFKALDDLISLGVTRV